MQIFANKDRFCCNLLAPKKSMHSNPEIRPKFESNSDSDLNVCHASMWKLQTHLWNPRPAKSVIGKPPKSFMSISLDSPSQSQVPNLIQYCSWNAVTAHSKRARIHIWRKVWKNFPDEISWILLQMADQEMSFCTPLLKW